MIKYQRIRDLREDEDLTQEKIAQKLHMHKTQYQRYENAEYNSFFEAMIAIANFYNVSLDYIAGRTNDKRGFNKSDLPQSEVNLLKKFRSLSTDRQNRILERIDVFAEEQEEEQAQIKDVG